jgi:hypothetical protein
MNDRRSPANEPDAPKRAARELFLLAALWLPMGFFLWFYLAPLLVWPVGRLVEAVLVALLPDAIDGLQPVRHSFDVLTLIPAERLVQGRVALLTFSVNPMIYGYGVPLLFGLVMATPRLRVWQRALQVLVGYAVLVLVQAWGITWEVLKDMQLKLGPLAAQTVAELGIPENLVALCYQLGYLILPPVAPLVVWILLNRRFLDRYIARPGARR